MKRFALVCLFLLVFAPVALADQPFQIDDTHTYDRMSRPYAQGYVPRIEGDTAYIVLPLTSDVAEGSIVADLAPDNPAAAPFKLSGDFDQTVKRQNYWFSKQKVSAYKVYFKLPLLTTRLNGEYPCTITVTGKDAGGNPLTQTFPIALRVTDGKPNDAQPDVAIEAFDAGEALYVGSSGKLTMRVANRSATREAQNVSLTMVDASGDILPDASDTLNIGTLAPGASAPVEIPVHALAKGSAQPHAIEFKLSFSYADNKAATKSEKHTVDLQQEVRLNHTEAALPTRVTQGENVQFNLTLMNMGKGTLYNALLTFDVPHMAAGGSVLAGTIEPGKSAAATANLRVDGDYEGDAAGTLKLTWEDAYGEPYEKTLPLSTTVLKKAAPVTATGTGTTGPDTSTSPDAKPSVRELAAWGLAAVFLILFGVKTILSSRKIRKLEEKQL